MTKIMEFPAPEEFKIYAESFKNMNETAVNIIKMFVSQISTPMSETDFNKFLNEYVMTCRQYVQTLETINQAYKESQDESSN